MYYCGRHAIDHKSSACPRCEAEERHEELIEATREGYEQAIQGSAQKTEKIVR